jgi:hypothetical protein
VQAVVVFWCEFPQGLVEDGPCVFVHGARLADWMCARAATLEGRMTGQVAEAVEEMARGVSSEDAR